MKRKIQEHIHGSFNKIKKCKNIKNICLGYLCNKSFFKFDDLLFQIINIEIKKKIEVISCQSGYVDLDDVLFNGFIIKESHKIQESKTYHFDYDLEVDITIYEL